MFDVDDTLYLERDYVRSGFEAVDRHVERSLRVSGFGAIAWQLFCEGHRATVFDEVLPRLDLASTPELVRELVAVYRRHDPSIDLLPDARSAMENLAGTALAVITDGPSDAQRAKIRALGLAAWCHPVVVTEELGQGFGKPHPRSYEMVSTTNSVAPTACVYVADNPAKDFIAPLALGWRTVRVRREGSLHEAVATAVPVDLEVESLDPFVDWAFAGRC